MAALGAYFAGVGTVAAALGIGFAGATFVYQSEPVQKESANAYAMRDTQPVPPQPLPPAVANKPVAEEAPLATPSIPAGGAAWAAAPDWALPGSHDTRLLPSPSPALDPKEHSGPYPVVLREVPATAQAKAPEASESPTAKQIKKKVKAPARTVDRSRQPKRYIRDAEAVEDIREEVPVRATGRRIEVIDDDDELSPPPPRGLITSLFGGGRDEP